MLFIKEAAWNKNFAQQLTTSSKFDTKQAWLLFFFENDVLYIDEKKTLMENQNKKDEWDAILPSGLRKTNYGS